MSEKILNSRMTQKHDIEANWLKATNFTPLQGELIVYDVDENYNYERIKMGDGVTNVNKLPFISSQVDWNQNDENAPDYVKNRTHWEEGVILPETELAVFEIEGATQYPILLSPLAQVEVGKKYVVVYNNTAYDIEAKFDEGDGVYSLAHDFGGVALFPEAIEYPSVGMIYGLVFAMDGSTPITLSIVEKDAPIHKLAPKFLPDTVVMAEPPVMEKVILPETVLSDDPDGGYAILETPLSQDIVMGKTYNIIYNGVSYKCEPNYVPSDSENPAYFFMGNMDIIELNLPNTNAECPFALVCWSKADADRLEWDIYGEVYTNDDATSVTLSIVEMEVIPQQLVMDKDGNIKWEDRTHWIENGQIDIFPKTTYEDYDALESAVATPFATPLIAGETYQVNWNGTVYECNGISASDGGIAYVLLGNTNILGFSGGNPDAPFILMEYPPEIAGTDDIPFYWYIMVTDSDGNMVDIEPPCTFGIQWNGKSIHKIDTKFLPEYDWFANEGEPGYIANRTHWTNEKTIEIIPETELLVINGVDAIVNPMTNTPIIGDTYLVTWNGVEYECIAQEWPMDSRYAYAFSNTDFGAVIIDTLPIAMSEDGTIAYGVVMYPRNTAEPNVLSITQPAGTVHKLDAKYLPDSIVNGNSFTTVSVNGRTYTAESASDTLQFSAGNGIELSIPRESTEVKISSNLNIKNGTYAHSVQLGALASADGSGAVAFGRYATATTLHAFAFGESATSSGVNAVAIGKGAVSIHSNSMAIGARSIASGWNALAIGNGAVAPYKNETVLGCYNHISDQLSYKYISNLSIEESFNVNTEYTTFTEAPSQDTATGTFTYNNTSKTLASDLVKGNYVVANDSTYYELLDSTGTSSNVNGNITHYRYHVRVHQMVPTSTDKGDYVLTVGNGTSDTDRSTAHAIDWSGNAYYTGDVYVQGDGKTFEFDGKKKLATEEYVDSKIPTPEDALALMIEMGFVDPVANETGAMYTDDNGKIFTY